ncbi:phage tail fiber [Escherichia coli]|uniref:glycine-rich domain-containing protein n=1 Tax=Escherichia coli TaxID=562 RepID=UPI0010CC8342|nr:hypothetical protein [Escherichia coli]GCT28473.1 phage tail fiber [Escherichia coli]
MYHVDNSTGVPVMPQPSPVTSETELFFTEGGNGVPPTFPGPDWFNIIQSELINILRAAGLDPDKMDNTQILAALKKLFLSRSNPFGDIKADGAAAIATALSNLDLVDALKNKQPLSDTLTKLSTLGPQTDADQVLFFSGKNIPAVSALTLAGRQFISKENVPDMLQYLTLGDGSGRLLGVQVFGTSGMYYKSPGVKKIIVEAVGGGGASGNLSATASNNCGISAAGSPGAYGKAFYYQNIPESVSVTVGSGGVGGAGPGGSGGDGGQTSFGSLLVCPGGKGSQQRQQVPPFSGGSAAEASPPTGAGLLFHSVSRSPSCAAFGLGDDMAVGLESIVSTMIGVYGKGGTGKYSPANSAASRGNDGFQGYIIVWEYQ